MFTAFSTLLLKAIGSVAVKGIINWSLKKIDFGYQGDKFMKKLGVLGKDSGFESIYGWSVLEYGLEQPDHYNPSFFSQEEVIDLIFRHYQVEGDAPFDLEAVGEGIRALLQDSSYLQNPGSFLDRKLIAFHWGILEEGRGITTIETEVEAFANVFKWVREVDLKKSNLHQYAIHASTAGLSAPSSSPTPKDLTHLVPRRLLSTTTGRTQHLADLRDMLETGQQIAVVNGMGGIGKTTLAEVYVEEYYHEYQHIAWLTQNNENFKLDLASNQYLANSLGTQLENVDKEFLFREMIRRMKALPGPCLLVVDNALPSIEPLLPYLPKGPEWHLLVTTRSELEVVSPLRLDLLKPADALTLFRNICTLSYDESRLEGLLEAIEYHTLTVELLAKTAKNRRLSMEQLEAALVNDQASAAAVAHSQKQSVERIGNYLSQVFALSDLSEDEKRVMKYWACLPASPIAYMILEKLIDPKAIGLEDTFGQLLNGLVGKGLLERDGEGDSYKVHALIGDIAWKDLQPQEQDVEPLVQNLAEALHIDQAKDNPIDKFIWEPYGRKTCNRFPHSTSVSISYLQITLAGVLQDLGDYIGAKGLLEKTVISTEKNFGLDHQNTTACYSALALVLRDLGDYTNAKILLKKAVALDKKNLGINHPTTAVHCSNLAMVLHSLGDYEGAKSLLEKVVASDEKNLPVDHPISVIHNSNLALVLKDKGDFKGAKILLEKAIAFDKKNFGPDHPNTAVGYSNLAAVLMDLGEYDRAKSLFKKTVALAENHWGTNHPTTANRYNNLAMVLKELGDDTNAKPLFEKALRILKDRFPTGHPHIELVQCNLDTLPTTFS